MSSPETRQDDPEQELIARAVDGEASAFAALYDRYVDRVYGFLKYRSPDDETAEDLTSEVFMRAWDSLDGFEPGKAPFGAWLFRVARNLAIDRARTRKSSIPLDALAPQAEGSGRQIEEKVATELDGERLLGLLQELTEAQREVLHLKFVEGLATSEVAKIVGKRPGAVRALQMRALQALEGIMAERGWAVE